HIDLSEVLLPGDANLLLSDSYNLSTAKALFPKWYARWNARGKAAGWDQTKIDSTFLKNGAFTAKVMEAYFTYHWHDIVLSDMAMVNMFIPYGEWKTTCRLYAGVGLLSGSGTFSDGHGMGSSQSSPWHERWNPEPGLPVNER